MEITIISGSPELDLSTVQSISGDYVIGVDYGAYQLVKNKLKIDMAIGDFDSINTDQFLEVVNTCSTVRKFERKKDNTDTELAILEAIDRGATKINLYGVTGRRLDHFLSTLNLFNLLNEKSIDLTIYDAYNKISLLNPGTTTIRKSNYEYISFFSYREPVQKLTLKGFKYNLTNHTIDNRDSLMMSNEIVEEEATIQFKKGLLLVVESRD